MLSKTTKSTSEIAKKFLKELEGIKNSRRAAVVALSGDLGAGKTTFTKFFAKHLGIREKVSSPTFVILKKYPLKKRKYKYFYHVDAYRLKNEKELLHLGWEEIINNKEHLIFIEWPENVSKVIPRGAKKIKISHVKDDHRDFKFKK